MSSAPAPATTRGNAAPAVSIRALSKTFPGQVALADVALDVEPGEIHALLGQNGSGKSTLIKVLAGIYTPDRGAQVSVAGTPLPFGSPRDSRRLGLQFVHQALGIVEDLTAIENVALGAGYRRRGGRFIDWRSQRQKTKRLLAKLSVEFDIDCPVKELRPVDRSAIAIARALDDDWGGILALVLDEPTAALPPSEVQALFGLVRGIREAGTSVLYVSHRLDEIFELADRATVLRDGVSQGSVAIGEVDRARLVRMIVGEDLQVAGPARARGEDEPAADRPALQVRGLRSHRIEGIDFTVHVGEVLGIAGLTGSGREELAGALVGQLPSRAHLVRADGQESIDPSPRTAKQFGVVLILPSRSHGAAIGEFTTTENLTLPGVARYARFGFISRRAERCDMRSWISALDIRPADPERAFALLSGGNQQKVVFSKWLNMQPAVLVVDDPTSGVDVGARQAIYELVRARAAEGIGVVVCSSDSEDLVAMCDRVLVLSDGQVVDEIGSTDLDESRLLTATLRAEVATSPATGRP